MKIEHRAIRPTEVRVSADDDKHTFEAVVMNYGVVDSYNTIFDAGCFRESLDSRMPRITWGHDWKDVIGQYVDYKDTPDSLTLIGELDDFDSVPRAKQAYAQLKSRTIDQFSVGFSRDLVTRDDNDVEHFTRATLDEAALVLSGAVPNTHLVSVRMKGAKREIDVETLILVARKVAAGEMSQQEADVALTLAAGAVDLGEAPPAVPDDTEPSASDLGAIAQADEALSVLGLG